MGITQIIGAGGERLAEKWLEREGFEIVARNWRSGKYELDLVAYRRGTIHFVEVKTRDSETWESPEDAMDSKKQRAFKYAVQAWLSQNPTDLEPQMDLIAIENTSAGNPEIRYIPEAVICRW
jgi:putative endonuclease